MQDNKVIVTAIKNPFEPYLNREIRYFEHDGSSVLDYFLKFYPIPPADVNVVASINGAIYEDNFDQVFPKSGDSLAFTMVPQGGGGGGGKGTLRTVAMIGVMVAATMATGGAFAIGGTTMMTLAGPVTSGGLFAAGSMSATMLSIGIGIGGSMLVNAVLPIQQADMGIDGSVGGGMQESTNYGWDSRNQTQEGKPFPILYGTLAIKPYLIGRYVETKDDSKQYLNLLYAISENLVNLSDYSLKIDGNPIKNYDDVDVALRNGYNEQSVIPYFKNTYYNQYLNVKVQYNAQPKNQNILLAKTTTKSKQVRDDWGSYHYYRTIEYKYVNLYNIGTQAHTEANNVSGLAVTFRFKGLKDDDGNSAKCFIKLGYRPYGSSGSFNYETFSIKKNTGETFDKTFIFDGLTPDQYEVRVDDMWFEKYRRGYFISSSWITSRSIDTGGVYLKSVGSLANMPAKYQTSGDAVNSLAVNFSFPSGLVHINNKNKNKNTTVKILVYYRKLEPDGSGGWQPASSWYGEQIAITDNTREHKRHQHTLSDELETGKYEVCVCFAEPPRDDNNTLNETYLEYILEGLNEKFTYPNTALLGMRALATDQLSNSMPDVAIDCSAVHAAQVKHAFDKIVQGRDYYYSARAENDGSDMLHSQIALYSNVSQMVDCEIYEYNADAQSFKHIDTQTYSLSAGTNVVDLHSFYVYDEADNIESIDSLEKYYQLVFSGLGDDLYVQVYGSQVDERHNKFYAFDIQQYSFNNPALISYDILTNNRYGGGLDPAHVQIGEFLSWADYCEQEGFFANIYFDSTMTIKKAIDHISTLGRASVVQRGNKYGVVVDRPIDIVANPPVQMFTMGNIIEGSFKEIFLGKTDRANAVEIAYFNKDNDYSREYIYLALPETKWASQKLNKSSVTLYGCTSTEQAKNYGVFLLNTTNYLNRTIEFEADVDAIACQVGDLIYFSHDVPQWGLASGRVVEYDSNTNRVRLDESIYCDLAKTYSLLYRAHDDTLAQMSIVPDIEENGETEWFALGSIPSTAPQQFDVYSFGEVDKISKVFRVIHIGKTQDQTAEIKAIEYFDEIFTDDYILSDLPNLSSATEASNLQASGFYHMREDGIMSKAIRLDWDGSADNYLVYGKAIKPDNDNDFEDFDVFQTSSMPTYYGWCWMDNGTVNSMRNVFFTSDNPIAFDVDIYIWSGDLATGSWSFLKTQSVNNNNHTLLGAFRYADSSTSYDGFQFFKFVLKNPSVSTYEVTILNYSPQHNLLYTANQWSSLQASISTFDEAFPQTFYEAAEASRWVYLGKTPHKTFTIDESSGLEISDEYQYDFKIITA